jgi:hypothetical protein
MSGSLKKIIKDLKEIDYTKKALPENQVALLFIISTFQF